MKNQELISLVNKGAKTIVSNPVVPILENFLVENNRLTSSDFQTYFIQNIPFSGSFLVPQKELKKILSKLPKDCDIELFAKNEEQLGIKVDSIHKFTLGTDKVIDYPILPHTWSTLNTIVSDDIKELKASIKYVSKCELRPAMNGVFLNGHIAATDGHRLRFHSTISKVEKPVVIPSKSVLVMQDNFDYQMSIDDKNYYKFEATDHTIIFRAIDEKFPDFLNVIPRAEDLNNCFEIPNSELTNLVELALITANKTTSQVRFSFENNAMTIHSEDLDYASEYTETVQVTANMIDPNFFIGFNGKFLLETLKDYKKDDLIKVNMWANNKAAIINDVNLLMPVLISEY